MIDFVWESGYRPNFVSDYGTTNAKIAVIGEAPGGSEDSYEFDPRTGVLLSKLDRKGTVIESAPANVNTVHYPFVGRSGKIWDQWLKYVGLNRDDLWISNVFPMRPQDNDFRTIPDDLLQESIQRLHEKLAKLRNVNVIVPMGNKALEALTGGKTGINDWRGSILSYTDLNGRVVKVIPTLHPAGWFRNANIVYLCWLDWKRIAEDSQFPELNLVEFPEPVVYPTIGFLDRFIRHCYSRPAEPMAVDIENDPNTHLITCIGFCISELAVSVPLEDGEYWTGGDLDNAWARVRIICEGPNPKILQGGFHDTFYLLRRKGIGLNNWLYDVLAESHCLVPTAPTSLKPHALDRVASVYMRGQYWKKSGKDD